MMNDIEGLSSKLGRTSFYFELTKHLFADYKQKDYEFNEEAFEDFSKREKVLYSLIMMKKNPFLSEGIKTIVEDLDEQANSIYFDVQEIQKG